MKLEVTAKSIYQPVVNMLKTVKEETNISYRMLEHTTAEFIDMYIHLHEDVIMNPDKLKSLDFLPDTKPDNILNEHILTSSVKMDIKNLFHTSVFIKERSEDDGLEEYGYDLDDTVLCLNVISSKYRDSTTDVVKLILTKLDILDEEDLPKIKTNKCYSVIDDYFQLTRECNVMLDSVIKGMRELSKKDEHKDNIEYFNNYADILSKHRILLQMPTKGEIIPIMVERNKEIESSYDYYINQTFVRQSNTLSISKNS